ncbi:endothelin-converting enzyme 2-like [Pollicipes pollicipes]|uniref:endothelin-converting enzyme 2-like n=1 Tax=Pollicipes pollicipes TaxID=41117 RepID=UPI001884A09D|nr:endothelin-converting enzyme 2-like [Pollicipes pollicipes]
MDEEGPPATLHMSAVEEPETVNDKRFLFSELGASRPVWVVAGYQVPKLPVLAGGCALLALLCVLLGGWCGALHGRAAPPPPPAECETAGCLRQAAEIASYLNSSSPPCQNFYEFACGRFDDVHPLGTEISYGVVDVLESLNKVRVEELLERTQFHNDYSAVSKAKTFYSTCMASFHGNSSSQRLQDLINSVGGLDLLDTFDPDEWSFPDVFLRTRENNRLRLFFSITWLQSLNRVMVSLPRLGLRNPRVYTDDSPKGKTKRDVYRQAIVAVLALVQADLPAERTLNRSCGDDCAGALADDVIYMETEIAKVMPKSGDLLPAPANIMSLEDMSQLASQFQWRRLLDTLFGTGVIAAASSVQIPSKEYMSNINSLIKTSNTTVLNNYFQWNLIRQYLPAMGPLYAILAEEMNFITQGKATKARQEVCFDLMRNYFPRALRALFIRGHIGENNVAAAQRLVTRVKRQLATSFGWMTQKARDTSITVLRNLQVNYGHSAWVTDPRRLNEYYGSLTLNKADFFTNMLNVDRFKASELKTNAARLVNDDASDDDVWVEGDTADVRVTYNPVRGRLRVPAGGLQVPLFSHENPDYCQQPPRWARWCWPSWLARSSCATAPTDGPAGGTPRRQPAIDATACA